jgi:hypothetical protein
LAESNAELTNAATSALRLLREVWVIERGIVARESPTEELERRAGHPLAWWAIRDRLAHALAAAEQEPSEAKPLGRRCEHCGKPMTYLDSADEYVHTFAADAEACVTEREPSEAQSLEPGSQPEK